jgi:adenylate kinase
MKYRTILLFGAPGSGKGTQGKVLGTIPGFFHCACGDVFRSLKTNTEIGKIFLEYSSRGELVPDEHTVQLWRNFIEDCIQSGRFQPKTDTLALDGIPRNVRQAELLRADLEVIAIFNLSCPDPEALVQRLQKRALKENRLDDANLEVIRHRLETYHRDTAPVLECYDSKLLHNIDATQNPVRVLHDILGKVITL